MKRSALLGATVAFCLGAPAIACEEYYEVDNTQAKEYVATLKDPAADEFDQVLAFDTLICAKRVALRDIALRAARAATSPSVRAQVLQRAMFSLQRVVVNFRPEEGMSKDVAEFIKTTPSVSFPIVGRFAEQSCISVHGKDCVDNAFQIVGNKVQLYSGYNYGQWSAELVLGDDGRLTGWLKNGKWKGLGPIPAEILLQ